MDSPQEIEAIEAWDTYQGLDISDEKPLIAPSTDIKGDLDSALSGDITFNGAFAYSNTYSDAPNPCLTLDGLGPIGLPLNEREARIIMQASAAGTGVETGIWTFPGEKVHFDNSQWDTWMKSTAIPAVNTALGAAVPATVLQYKVKSLTLRQVHAETINTYEEMKEDSLQYGTLSIVLPSRHVGGQIRIMHQGTTKTFSTAGHGAASITLIGAYTGVSQYLDSLQSGYVICLSYELSYLGEVHSVPRLPQLVGTMNQLRNVFRSWRQMLNGEDEDYEMDYDEEPPEILACLFTRTYKTTPAANFKAMSLIGSDRLMLKHIAPVAKAYGFDLHISSVKYTERGGVTLDVEPSYPRYRGYGGYGRYGRAYYDDSDDEDWDETEFTADDVVMDEVDETTLDFHNVVALDGMPMVMSGSAVDCLDVGDEDDENRCFVNGSMTDGNRVGTFERYERDSGSLQYTYERSALIISPNDLGTVNFTVGDVREFACTALKVSLSETPTAKELRLVDALQAWLEKNQSGTVVGTLALASVANVLRDSSDRWNDVGLYVRTLRSCGSANCISVMGIDGLVSAYQAFDWSNLKDIYAEGLSKTTSNDLRGQFVERLLATAKEQDDAEVVSWCEAQREALLETIQKLEVSEVNWIINLVQSKANPTTYLTSNLIPRLQTVQPSDVPLWTALLSRIHEIAQSGSPLWDTASLPETIKTCIERIGTNMEAYPVLKSTRMTHGGYPLYRPVSTVTETVTIEPIIAFLELGARFGGFEGCMPVLQRMWAGKDVQQTACPQRPPKTYYDILVSRLKLFLQDKPQFKKPLEPFFCQAASVLLPSYPLYGESFKLALEYSGNAIMILKGFLTAERVKEMAKTPSTLKQFAMFVSQNLRPQAITEESKIYLQTILKLCLAGMIGTFNYNSLMSNIQRRSAVYPYAVVGGGITEATDLLELCFTLRLRSDAIRVLNHFLGAPKANEAAYIKDGLVRMVKALPDFLKKYNLSIVDAPYSKFVAEVVKKYIRVVLGAKPTYTVPVQELKAVGCGCQHCVRHLVPFMLSDREVEHIREKQAARTHLEGRLSRVAASWGIKCETIRQGSPHTLKITKPQRMVAFGQWSTNQIEAQNLMRVLGGVEQQRLILAAEYTWIVGTIAGTTTPPLPLAPQAVNGVPAPKRPATASGTEGLQAKKPRLS